jgi:hypothetical protein
LSGGVECEPDQCPRIASRARFGNRIVQFLLCSNEGFSRGNEPAEVDSVTEWIGIEIEIFETGARWSVLRRPVTSGS